MHLLSDIAKRANRYKKVALLFVCMLASWAGVAQTPATQAIVVTSFSPPYTIPLGELTSQQLHVTITALNGYIDDGKVSVLIQGNNGIRIQNNILTSPFNLQLLDANIVQLTDGDLQDLFTESTFTSTGISVAQAFSEGLPPGSYEICFRVYVQGRTGFAPISQQPPAGCGAFIIQDSPTGVVVNTIVQPPPHTPQFSEYVYKIQSTLQSATTRNVRLFLTIKGDNGITIRSRQGVVTQDVISLQAGVPYMLSSIDLDPYLKYQNLIFNGTSANAVNNNGLPEGNYRFCVRAVDMAGNFVSADDPLGCSNLVNIRLLEPPQLIAPKCGTTIKQTAAQSIIFTWTPPPGAPPGLPYTFRIVEMIDPSKDPNDAMLSATTPAFFEETILGATTFLYGPAQPVLEPGRKYAWQVIAGLGAGADYGDMTMLFRNKGKSAVCWFMYENDLPLTGTVALAQSTPANSYNGMPGGFSPNTYGTTPSDVFLSNAVIKGKIVYNFFFGQEQPMANVNVKLIITYVRLQGGKKEVLAPGPKYTDMGKVLAMTKTDASGNFAFLCTLKDSDLPKSIEGAFVLDPKTGKASATSFVVYRTARVVVENPYFLSPDEDITLKKNETVETGILKGGIREYALKVSVVSRNKLNNYGLKIGEVQAALNNYDVYLLRQVRPLGVPAMEGTLPAPRTMMKGMEVIAKGTSNKDGAVLFFRLVKNIGPGDKYFLYAETKPENLTNFYCEPTPVAFNFDQTLSKYKLKQLSGAKKDEAVYLSEYKIPGAEFNLPMKARAGEIDGTVRRDDNTLEGIPGAEVRMWELEDTETTSKEQQLYLLPFIKPFYNGVTSGGSVFYDASTGMSKPATAGKFHIGNIYPTILYEGGTLIKKDAPLRPLRVTKFGYHPYQTLVPEILMGQRKIMDDITLKPNGTLIGEVVNEKGEFIMAQVSVPGGKSVSTEPGGYVTKPTNGMYLYLPTKSVFEVMAPFGQQKLSVIPDNVDAYLPYDTLINVTQNKQNVGKIKLLDNAYRIRVKVKEYINNNPNVYTLYLPGATPKPSAIKAISGAKVSIQYISQEPTLTNAAGIAEFKFKSMAADFKILVEAPENQMYESACATVTAQQLSKSKKDYLVVEVALKKAAQIQGTVKVGNSPVANAKVFVTQSSVNGSSLETFTNEQGVYTLKNLPMNVPLEISAVKGKSQYIGDVKSLTLTSPFNDGIDFNLTQYNGIVLTELLGIPVEIKSLEESGDVIKLTGSFTDLPLVKGLSLYNTDPLTFSMLEVTKSNIKNAQGISYASPVSGKIPLELPELTFKLNDKLILKQPAQNELLEITDDGQGKGILEAPLYVDISNFAVNNLAVESNTIRLAAGTGSNLKLLLQTIHAGSTTAPDKYFIVNEQGKNLHLKYHNFDTEVKSQQSFIDGENLRLACILHTNLKNISPGDIHLDIGELIVTPTGAGDIVNRPPFDITIDAWKMSAVKWSISNSGFKIHEGMLKTGVVEVPFTQLTVYPNGLHDDAKYNFNSLSFNNLVALKVMGTASFGFDNTKNLWSLRVDPQNDSYAALMDNLPVIKTNDAFRFSSIALFSNGTSLVMMDSKAPPVTFYDLATFEGTDIQITKDAVTLLGQLDLHLAQAGKASGGIAYTKEGGKLVGKILPVAFNFKTTALTVNIPTDNQTFTPGKFEAAGVVFEDDKFNFKIKLTHLKNSSKIELSPGQSYQLTDGKKSSLTKLAGSMHVANGVWNELYFEGDLTGTEGASGRLGFTVKGDWVASNQKIGVKNIPTDFGGIALTYNFDEDRLEGSLHYEKQISSTQYAKGDATAIVDNSGWHFVSTGVLSMTNPKSEGQAGLVFGDYHMTPEIRKRFEETSFVYQKAGHLPEVFPQQVKGFYFEGGVSLPVPVVPSVDFNFGLVSGYLYANIGGDLRNSMQFSDGLSFGVGQSIFADVGVGLGASVVVACAGCSANLLAMLNYDGQITTGGSWFVDGEGLITLKGSTYKGFGICDSDCDGTFCDKSSKSASVTVGAKAHFGSDYKEIKFYLK